MAGVDASAMWELVSSLQGLNGNGSGGSTEQATCTRDDNDGTVWVRLLGAEIDTPVNGQRLADVVIGDNVTVTIEDGLLSVIGNSSRPSTSASHVEEIVGPVVQKVTEVVSVVADKASVGELQAATARIGELEADHVAVDDLTAVTGRIQSLESDHVSVDDFQAEQANIDTLQANTADIATIRANSAKVQNLTAAQLEADHATIGTLDTTYATIANLNAANGRITNLESTKANISDLEANYITADEIEATYMHANMSNSDVAWIENGTIKNGAIVSAMINDVSANKLTAGTINGSVINVTNLNADNITTGTINGQRIGEGSLSLSKLDESVYTEAEVNSIVDGLNDRIDGAIETYTGTVVPTLSNSPASGWNTTKLRDEHVGDVYYVVNSQSQQNGYCYRFTKSGSTYSWQLIKDSDVTAALSRLTTAEGKISSIEQFDVTVGSFMTDTDDELSSLKTRTTSLETSLGDKVDTSTFNTVSQKVDANEANITSMSTVLTNNGLTSSTNITNTVNSVSQTATGNSSKITQLTTTLGTNADGTTKAGDIVHRTSAVEQDLSGITTRVGTLESTTTAHGTRLTNAETSIGQNADAIALRATKTEVQQVRPAYASSSTAAGTAAKVATIDPAVTGYALYKGASVAVTFSTANTAATPTLNLNSTGAKQIRSYTGAALSEAEYKWAAGATVNLVYDGTYWRMQDGGAVKRVTAAEASIRVNADNIESKVSKDGVISSINQSAETVKIQASKVEIDGTAVFSAISSDVDSAIISKGYQTSSQVDSAITSKGYATTSQVSTAKSEAISSANSATDTKLQSYSTTAQANNLYDAKGAAASLISGGENLIGGFNLYSTVAATYDYTTGTMTSTTTSNTADNKVYLNTFDGSTYVQIGDGIGSEGVGKTNSWTFTKAAGVDYVRVKFNGNKQDSAVYWHISGVPTGTELTFSFYLDSLSSDGKGNGGILRGINLRAGNMRSAWSLAPQDIISDTSVSKADAAKRTHRIWYRWNSATAPAAPSTWVTKGDDGSALWTKMHVAITSTHKYIYTCEQYEMADGTLGHTDVLLDNTITVIDGGNIITGTVSANAVNAASGTFDVANIPNLSAAKITSGDISADRIKANVISAINSLTAGQIDAARINASQLTIGQSQVTNLTSALNAKANSNNVYTKSETDAAITAIEIGGRNLLIGSSTGAGWSYSTFDKSSVTYARGTTAISESYVHAPLITLKAGETYTLSCWAKSNGNVKDMDLFKVHGSGSGSHQWLGAIPLTTEWQKIVWTFVNNATSDETVTIRFDNNGSKTSGTEAILYIREPKLEKGNKATDWSPAPEDTSEEISDAVSAVPSYVVKTSNYVYTYDQWKTYAAEGHTDSWSTINGVKAGDTVLIKGTVSDTQESIYVLVTVNTVNSSGAITNATSHGLVDQNALSRLSVGGRNLLRNTGSLVSDDMVLTRATVDGDTIKLTPTTSSSYAKFKVDYLDYSDHAEGYYTLSFEYRVSDDSTSYTATQLVAYVGFNVTSRVGNTFSSSYDRFYSETISTDYSTEWTRATVSVSIPSGLTTGQTSALVAGNNLTVQFGSLGSKKPTLIRNVKLEKGNKATDWTPAPEDVDTDISEAAKTATNYIVADSSGIKIADANPSSATTYLHLASSFLDFIRGGVSMLKAWLDGSVAMVRVGAESGFNTLTDGEGIKLRNGTTVLGQFATNLIELGKNSTSAVISFCNGKGKIGYETDRYGTVTLKGTEYGGAEIASETCYVQADNSGVGIYAPDYTVSVRSEHIALIDTEDTYEHEYLMDDLVNAIPVTLYDNDSASASAATTLSESAANFKRLTIFYKDQDNTYSSVDVWEPNGKRVALDLTWINGASTQQMYQRVRWVTISGTTISTAKDSGDSKYRTGQVRLGGSYSVTNSDYISIVHVIGYR